MLLTLIQTQHFVSGFRNLQLEDEDLRDLEKMLIEQPDCGKPMARTGGVRKARFSPRSIGQGKRGAFRICYAWFPEQSTIALFLIYRKNEKDTLSSDDEKACRLLVKRMRLGLERS